MKKWLVSLALLASVCVCATAHAAPAPPSLRTILKNAFGTIVVPPEWAGIWSTVDSTSDCAGGPVEVSALEDTICGGEAVTPPEDGPYEITCTGTVDGSTIDVTCTGGGQVIPDCNATVTYHLVITRTEDSFYSVGTYEIAYAGTALGCDLIPDQCTRIASIGTRTGPAPEACLTPAKRATWGSVKTLYR